MRKLLLIHPGTRSPFAGFGDTAAWGMPPLALAQVAALTPDTWAARVVDEYVEKIDPQEEDADLVGISTYSVNATRAYELAEAFRGKGVPVVMGGIHVSMVPEEALNYADAVVVGEAESVWRTVLSDLENGSLKRVYHGERLPLNGLPVPRRDLLSDSYEMDIIQTTRGCPHACEFCSVTAFNGAKYRQRPVNEVLDELQGLRKRLVYFVDDNFFGFGSKAEARALELFNGIVARGIRKIWVTQASIDVGNKPDLLTAAFRSGCRGLFIGFESPVLANLQQIEKTPNLSIGTEGIKRAARTIRRNGICIIGSFIVGFDGDDISVFRQTLDLAKEADAVQYQFLTPFPGTRLHQRLAEEKRIIYNVFPDDWARYDLDHLMMRPKNIDIVDLVRGFDYLIDRTFSRGAVLSRAFRTLARTRSIAAALLAYGFNRDSARVFAVQRDIQSRMQ